MWSFPFFSCIIAYSFAWEKKFYLKKNKKTPQNTYWYQCFITKPPWTTFEKIAKNAENPCLLVCHIFLSARSARLVYPHFLNHSQSGVFDMQNTSSVTYVDFDIFQNPLTDFNCNISQKHQYFGYQYQYSWKIKLCTLGVNFNINIASKKLNINIH